MMIGMTTRWLIAGGVILTGELLAGSSALIAPAPARAAPDIFLKIRHDLIHITGTACDGSVRAGDGSVRKCVGSVFVGRHTASSDEGDLDVAVVWDNDPFISFSIGTKNNTTVPLTFSFTFSMPYVGGPYDTMIANLKGSVTEGTVGVVSETSASPISLESILDGGVIAGLTLGGPCAATGLAVGNSIDCGPYGPSSATVAGAAAGTMGLELVYTLSSGDSASFTGMVELTRAPDDVPAPATVLMLAGALGGLALRRRV